MLAPGVMVGVAIFVRWGARPGGRGQAYSSARRFLGPSLLLLVPGDIIGAVAVTPASTFVAVLGDHRRDPRVPLFRLGGRAERTPAVESDEEQQ